jgi:hypothetical protein
MFRKQATLAAVSTGSAGAAGAGIGGGGGRGRGRGGSSGRGSFGGMALSMGAAGVRPVDVTIDENKV